MYRIIFIDTVDTDMRQHGALNVRVSVHRPKDQTCSLRVHNIGHENVAILTTIDLHYPRGNHVTSENNKHTLIYIML